MADNKTSVEDLRKAVRKFAEEREWRKYHDVKNLSMSISIEASELMEIFQWVKSSEVNKILKNERKFEELKSELADVIIYCLRLSDEVGIDISKVVLDKLEENVKKYPAEKVKGSAKKYTELELNES